MRRAGHEAEDVLSRTNRNISVTGWASDLRLPLCDRERLQRSLLSMRPRGSVSAQLYRAPSGHPSRPVELLLARWLPVS